MYVNELAPRPHNSGHYSIEACSFSQFDAHIRGISGALGYPITSISGYGESLRRTLRKATSYARQNPLGKSITMEKPNQKLAEKWATSPLQHLAYQKR